MIKTVIFDIGNVLMDFRWQDFFRGFGYSEEIQKRLAAATVKSPVWNEYDLGNWSEEEILEGFIRNDPELEAAVREVFSDTKGIVTLREGTIPWIRSLKERGYRVLVLSNFSEKVRRECREEMCFLAETDGGILSYEDHVIKPMPEIYRLLIDRYELNPEECVFLDDLPENLEGARAFGIRTILVKSQEQAKADLELALAETQNGNEGFRRF